MLKVYRKARPPWAALLLFAMSCVLLLAFMDVHLGGYDEGLILTGAQLVASGAVPHRDFYANYGPAQFYALAALFEMFGTSFLVARIYDAVIRAAIIAIVFSLLAGRCRSRIALAAAVVCGVWLWGSGSYGYPVIPVLALALLGTCLLTPVADGPIRPARLVAAGALTGLAALFRYDIAFFVLVAHLAALALLALRPGRALAASAVDFLRQALLYAAATALVFLPPAAALLWAGAGTGFVHDILYFPSHYYVRMRSLPFPGVKVLLDAPSAAVVYLPFGAALLCAAALVRSRQSREAERGLALPDERFALFTGLLSAILILKGLVRVSPDHMLPAIVPAVVLLAFLYERRTALGPRWRRVLVLVLTVAVATAAAQTLDRAKMFSKRPDRSLIGSTLDIHRADGVGVRTSLPNVANARVPLEMACAAELVAALSKPDERIFVGTGRHDKIHVNNVAFYFAAGRLPGVHWHHFDPGLQTRQDVQQQMIAELETAGVRWVVRDSSADDIREPNESAISSGVTTLDRYLTEHYRPVAAFGPISVDLRKTEAIPTLAQAARCRSLGGGR